MAEAKKVVWYVKGAEEKVFGPIDSATLVAWAKEGRIESSFSLSCDERATWVAAPLVAELGMVWLVETTPGTFYGPFNRAVVDGLLAQGTITAETRLYSLDEGKAREKSAAENAAKAADEKVKRAAAELDAAKKTIAELEGRAARQAETTKKTMSFMEAKLKELTDKLAEMTEAARSQGESAQAELAAAREEVFKLRTRIEEAETRVTELDYARNLAETRVKKSAADLEACEQRFKVAETEIADLRSQLETLTKFTAVEESAAKVPRTEKTKKGAIEPEIVKDEPPPKAAGLHFAGKGGTAGLAALEAAARRELAAAKRQGIGISGLFGGKK
jgi:hypothetical protein